MVVEDEIRRIQDYFSSAARIQADSVARLGPSIAHAAHRLGHTLEQGGKILVCGNGGSAADSQHFAAEFTNRFERERDPLPAIALTTDSSALTAIGNDYSFDEIFSKQVRAIASAGDALIAISTSGGSENVVRAIDAAHAKGGWVLALTGRDGGRMGSCLSTEDIELRVPAQRTAHIQEVHIMMLHCICDLIDSR